MNKDKPHKGTINNWVPFYIGHPEDDIEKDTLINRVIIGWSEDHPQFGGGSIRTSLVVEASEPDEDGVVEIETLNSRYTLVDRVNRDIPPPQIIKTPS